MGHNFSAPVVSRNGRTSTYWLVLRIVDWEVAERLGSTCMRGVEDDISGCYCRGVSISLRLSSPGHSSLQVAWSLPPSSLVGHLQSLQIFAFFKSGILFPLLYV